MADYQLACEKVLAREGGYSNLALDRGGERYKDIARKCHPNWPGWCIINKEKSFDSFPKRLDKTKHCPPE